MRHTVFAIVIISACVTQEQPLSGGSGVVVTVGDGRVVQIDATKVPVVPDCDGVVTREGEAWKCVPLPASIDAYTKAEASGQFAAKTHAHAEYAIANEVASTYARKTDLFTKDAADVLYAGVGHDHNETYAAKAHNHDAAYAAIGHAHDGVYAPLVHAHDDRYRPLAGKVAWADLQGVPPDLADGDQDTKYTDAQAKAAVGWNDVKTGVTSTTDWPGTVPSTRVTGGNVGGIGGSGTIGIIAKFTASGALGDSVIKEANGNVGIGTTTPAAPLHVASASNAVIRLDSGGTSGGILTAYNGATPAGAIALFSASDPQLLNVMGSELTNATARLTVLRSGNVGIGTTVPTSRLHLKASGGATVTFDGENLVSLIGGHAGGLDYVAGTGGRHTFVTAGADRMVIAAGGNVGVGTTTPSARLDVAGDIVADNYYVWSKVVNANTVTALATLRKRDTLLLLTTRLVFNDNGFCSYVVHVASGNSGYGGSPQRAILSSICDGAGTSPNCTITADHSAAPNLATIKVLCTQASSVSAREIGL